MEGDTLGWINLGILVIFQLEPEFKSKEKTLRNTYHEKSSNRFEKN
jgi:hypothetical protein